MIPTLLGIALTSLRRDRVVQAMTFLLPVLFFSIFAVLFGSQGPDVTAQIHVAVVDDDRSEGSGRLIAALRAETGLRIRTRARRAVGPPDTSRAVISRMRALELVKDGEVPVAIVIPEGFGAGVGSFADSAVRIELLSDRADPVAPQVVSGLLQKTAMAGAPGRMARRSLVPVRIVDVLGERKSDPLIALTAAGIAVMFLLFSASGAGGTLLDEVESGTLERLLTSHAGMGTILLGKWLFVMLLGVFQITVMFVWGMAVFRLDLMSHLAGFFVITIATAAAAAGFGLVLATLCKTRQQLGGVATILILTQSAIGGSMFPRFLMNDQIRTLGRFTTFNANALDGYEKVFWREARLIELWPQVAVLAALTVAFLMIARLLARRWETV